MLIEPSSLLDYTVCERHEFQRKTHSIFKSLSYKLTLLKDFSPKSNEHELKYSAWIDGTDRQLERFLESVHNKVIWKGGEMVHDG